MAKQKEWSPGIRPGRRQHETFDHLVSPLGKDGAQRNDYSPRTTVEGSRTGKDKPGNSEFARTERRR